MKPNCIRSSKPQPVNEKAHLSSYYNIYYDNTNILKAVVGGSSSTSRQCGRRRSEECCIGCAGRGSESL